MMQRSIFQNDSELRSCLLSLSLKWLYIKIKLSEFFTFCTSQCIYPLSFGDFFVLQKSISCFVKIVMLALVVGKTD